MCKKNKKAKNMAEDLVFNNEELSRYDDVYKQYRYKYLKMNDYQLKRERYLCEKEIRAESIVSDNGRIALVISFFSLFSNFIMSVFEPLGNFSEIVKIIVSIILFSSVIYLFWYGTEAQNKTRSRMEDYYLRIMIIDEILNQSK